jgi:hypothetical protein
MAFLILLASLIAPVYSTPAHAAFGAVGPLDPATKFPFWYQDATGLRLGYCFDPAFCVPGAQLPDPTKPPSVPNNFPEETFYWDADTSMPTNKGGQALMTLAVEGAFLPGPGVVDGQQVTFGRVRFRITNLTPGANYTITYPYGVVTFQAQAGRVPNTGAINNTTDVGCGAAVPGVVTCDFTIALNSPILERFLTWDTFGSTVDAPPAGFIGNFSVPHRVTGSPNIMPGFPTGTNFFRVEGPDVGGPGVNSIQTDLFQLAGQLSGLAVTASPGGGLFNKAQAVSLTASDPAATIYFTTDGTTPTTASPQYTGTPIPITATTTLQYMAVDAQGTQSPVGSQTYTIDTVPPVVSLTGQPTNLTNNTSPSFTFAADDAGTTFACSLARGTAADAFTACSSPKGYSGLAAGTYTFKVQATDPAGNVSVTPYTFTIDTVPPMVSLTAKPTTPTNNANPSFTFASNKAGTTFACSLATAADVFTACSSPQSYSGLADGTYTFKVRATDPAGNVNLASYAFTIDTAPPPLSISGKPVDPTNNASPSFTFSSTEAGTSFRCSLATGADAFAPCTSPKSYTAQPDGAYTFKVQATDPAGNVDLASYAFVIDTVAPVVSLTSKPAALGNNANPSFVFSADKAGMTFRCALDAAALTACTSPQDYTALASGAHTFKVQGTNPAGNSSTATYAFTIDTAPPSVPTGLRARATSASAITLSWIAATDAVGVSGYKVFRDGATRPIGTVASGTTFADRGLAPSSSHRYTVVAVDAAGNASAPSVVAAATTLTPPATAQLKVIVRVPRAIIPHGAPVVVSVRTRPGADTRITLRLTRQGTRCTGAARQRVCARVSMVLAQRVVHVRANRQGLLTRSVTLGYSPASALRATLGVHVWTPYGAVTHAVVVRLQAAPRVRQR